MQLVLGHIQLAFQLSIFIHGLVSLNFACQLTVVQVLLLEQLSLPLHQLVSPTNRFLASLLHVLAGLCYSTLVTGTADGELSPLSLEPLSLTFVSIVVGFEVDLTVIVDGCEVDCILIPGRFQTRGCRLRPCSLG